MLLKQTMSITGISLGLLLFYEFLESFFFLDRYLMTEWWGAVRRSITCVISQLSGQKKKNLGLRMTGKFIWVSGLISRSGLHQNYWWGLSWNGMKQKVNYMRYVVLYLDMLLSWGAKFQWSCHLPPGKITKSDWSWNMSKHMNFINFKGIYMPGARLLSRLITCFGIIDQSHWIYW